MASTIKVDNVQNQPGTNIISKCSTTITLGASSDTVALAAGATQTGFGRTGTVDWITTPKVTGDSPITGVTGKGYFLDTTAGTITLNLPAGAAGSIVSMADYAATWQTNKVTVAANGSEKIGGDTNDATLNTKGQSVTFVYVDSTQGWLNTMDSTSNVRGQNPYVAATGGTPCSGAICGDYKTHAFTGPGTLCVSSAGNCAGSNSVDYLIVGGGGGARSNGGGAGGGGFRVSNSLGLPAPLTSPLATPAGITVTATPYAIVVGGGGTPGTPSGATNGILSSFGCLSSAGGGVSGGTPGDSVGGPGGSGGGGDYNTGGRYGGTGNTPPVSPAQGQNGGIGAYPYTPSYGGGGGGGAGAVGSNGCSPLPTPGQGGVGSYISPVFGTTYGTTGPVSSRYFSGGGGADANPANGDTTVAGGSGGGGQGGPGPTGTAGTVNTGGGGGGGQTNGGGGGSGIVIIRYKFQ
jgi:hypothetical protein